MVRESERFFCVWFGALLVNSTDSVESVLCALLGNPQIRQAARQRLCRVLFLTAVPAPRFWAMIPVLWYNGIRLTSADF